jgi:hypothetical protein
VQPFLHLYRLCDLVTCLSHFVDRVPRGRKSFFAKRKRPVQKVLEALTVSSRTSFLSESVTLPLLTGMSLFASSDAEASGKASSCTVGKFGGNSNLHKDDLERSDLHQKRNPDLLLWRAALVVQSVPHDQSHLER